MLRVLSLKLPDMPELDSQHSAYQPHIPSSLLMLGMVAFLIIIVLLIYNRFHLKRITKERLELLQQQIATKNQLLEMMTIEKEWLLKEVHHRVKNNLQTVVSLLEAQSAYLQSREALSAIQDSQNRVHAMSLIHQKLYRTDHMTSIDVSVYIPELVQYLSESFDVQHNIRFDLNIEPMHLDVSQIIPVGLIVNEAITNSIKYGFTKGMTNNLIIVIMTQVDKAVTIYISDNGKGMPPDFDIDSDQCGLGLKLMKGLTEDIDGDFGIRSEDGVKITITFAATMPLSMRTSHVIPNDHQSHSDES